MLFLNTPLSIYNARYLPYIFRDYVNPKSINFDENNIKIINSIYNINYLNYLKKVEILNIFDSNSNKESKDLLKYTAKTLDNKIIINKKIGTIIYAPN